jgi:hypothetical protein
MPNFVCEICDFVSSKESNLHKHFSTHKHHGNVMEIVLSSKKMPKNAAISHDYRCANCDRKFTTNSGLWKHKKVCINAVSANENKENKENKEDIAKLTALITQLMTQNTELIKKIGTTNNITTNNTNNTTNTNNINKSKNFNIQFFLNETCKDALNISEFVESLKITLEDLDFSRKNGLVSGITDVMIKGLKQLDVTKRPIHCTDKKRETMYIKDKEKWEKDETHEKMKNTIIQIAKKERNALTAWVEENPDWMETESKQIEYLTIMRNVCEPIEDYDKNNKKIIRNLTANVFVDKETQLYDDKWN